jgi:hypothetical protein
MAQKTTTKKAAKKKGNGSAQVPKLRIQLSDTKALEIATSHYNGTTKFRICQLWRFDTDDKEWKPARRGSHVSMSSDHFLKFDKYLQSNRTKIKAALTA